MVEFEIYATGTDEDVNAGYYAYIKDAAGEYFDSDDSTFKPFIDLIDGKLSFSEDSDQPGAWNLAVDLGTPTSTFMMFPRDAQTDLLLNSQVETFFLLDGERLIDPRTDQAALYEHYSGFNALQLLDESGDPVEGAHINVYTKDDYDQENYDKILGTSTTKHQGHWTHPVYVEVGVTYTIVYYKEGEISTTTTDVTVP